MTQEEPLAIDQLTAGASEPPPTDHAREEGRSSGETRFFQGMSWAESAGRTGPGQSENCHEPRRARPRFLKM